MEIIKSERFMKKKMEMDDSMRTITFVGFSLTVISVEDLIKEIPHILFKA